MGRKGHSLVVNINLLNFYVTNVDSWMITVNQTIYTHKMPCMHDIPVVGLIAAHMTLW
jgi:hypothetical protein